MHIWIRWLMKSTLFIEMSPAPFGNHLYFFPPNCEILCLIIRHDNVGQKLGSENPVGDPRGLLIFSPAMPLRSRWWKLAFSSIGWRSGLAHPMNIALSTSAFPLRNITCESFRNTERSMCQVVN